MIISADIDGWYDSEEHRRREGTLVIVHKVKPEEWWNFALLCNAFYTTFETSLHIMPIAATKHDIPEVWIIAQNPEDIQDFSAAEAFITGFLAN